MIQLYIGKYIFLFRFFSLTSYYKILSIVPCVEFVFNMASPFRSHCPGVSLRIPDHPCSDSFTAFLSNRPLFSHCLLPVWSCWNAHFLAEYAKDFEICSLPTYLASFTLFFINIELRDVFPKPLCFSSLFLCTCYLDLSSPSDSLENSYFTFSHYFITVQIFHLLHIANYVVIVFPRDLCTRQLLKGNRHLNRGFIPSS